jgi:3-oxoacyl-[acyl-carrier protein] reductase
MTKQFDFGLSDRTALVCASSAGLGRGCAEALALAGARVVLNGRNPKTLRDTAAEIQATTGRVVGYIVADVQSRLGREAILDKCTSPDILVNNAAGPPTGDFREFDEAIWERAVRDTMIAPIMTIRAVLDGMIKRGSGRIINGTMEVVSPLRRLR